MESIVINSSEDYYQEKLKIIKSFFPGRIFKQHQIEEILYRMYLCKECFANGKCPYCKCEPHDTMTDLYSCNKNQKFPKLPENENQWEIFKKQHNIVVQ